MNLKTLCLAGALLVLPAFGCRAVEKNAALKDTVWLPTNFKGQDGALLDREGAAWLLIADNNRVGGRGGVNSFFGDVILGDGDKISFEKIGSTLMAGPNQEFEDKFLKILAEVKSYEIRGQILMFRDKDGQIIATFNVGPERTQ